MFLRIIESIAYAVTRGAIKAVWEELRKPRTAVDEEVTNEDSAIEDRLRARLALWLQADEHDNSGSNDAPPVEPEGAGEGVA